MSVIKERRGFQVAPASRLKLRETNIEPGFGVTEPEMVREEPALIEFELREMMMSVGVGV